MKAQIVKNAVIVPVGAKGGFVVKRPPAGDDRAALRAEVVECYRTFMRGLLDVTDTIAAGEIVPPSRRRAARRGRPVPRRRGRQGHGDLLRHRERDLGRVRLLARRRVRLGRLGRLRPQGDGDHRPGRLGVGASGTSASSVSTSRRRTSRWSGSATCPATCSGTACCSLVTSSWSARSTTGTSFSTPIPTRERSFVERERLFRLPGSSWADYDPALISKGGGVFPRTAKSIPLSAEVRARARTSTPRR